MWSYFILHLKKSLQSPLWLLFLDCVHQLGVQQPSSMEFSSEYLVSLWHAAHCSIYSTFMFDCINSRLAAVSVSIHVCLLFS